MSNSNYECQIINAFEITRLVYLGRVYTFRLACRMLPASQKPWKPFFVNKEWLKQVRISFRFKNVYMLRMCINSRLFYNATDRFWKKKTNERRQKLINENERGLFSALFFLMFLLFFFLPFLFFSFFRSAVLPRAHILIAYSISSTAIPL